MPDEMADRPEITMEPLDDAVDHVRGGAAGRLIVEYGDYECPYSRRATQEIARVERSLGDGVRFAFRHFPLTEIHPHALAASAAAEAAALQGRFWEMHELLFDRQKALPVQSPRTKRHLPAGAGSSASPSWSWTPGATPYC